MTTIIYLNILSYNISWYMTVWCIWLYMIVQHISIFICFKERKKSRTAKHASDHDTYIITPEQYNRNTYNTLSYVWSSQHQVQRFQFISAHSHVITQKNMYWSSGTILSCASFNAPRLKDSKMCNGISGSTFESIIGVRGGGGGDGRKLPGQNLQWQKLTGQELLIHEVRCFFLE